MKNKLRSSVYGFTLVELQVAIVILMLIFALLSGVIFFVSKSFNTSTKIVRQQTMENALNDFFRQQINGIVPFTNKEQGHLVFLFQGDNQHIYYIGNLPEYLVETNPWLIYIHLNEKHQLQMSYRKFDPKLSWLANIEGDYKDVTLTEHVKELEFSYAPLIDNSHLAIKQKNPWHTSWAQSGSLPSLIRVKIKLDGKNSEIIEPVNVAKEANSHLFTSLTPN